MKGKLKSGFTFEVDDKALDNMELIDAMAEAEDDNPQRFSKAVLLLLGKDQRNKLYNHLRTDDGRVPIESVSNAFVEIFTALGEQAKNS